MKSEKKFEILQRAGGIRSARIIWEENSNLSYLRLYYIAFLLRRGTPVAKIIHQKWFYGFKFYTNKNTLDPRPDTETLVQTVLDDFPQNAELNILDMGTGTGCIIGTLAKKMPLAQGVGIDISRGAVRVARKNIRDLGLSDRVKIYHKDFSHPEFKWQNYFYIIVSNPPYIALGDSRVDIGARHDPGRALYAGPDGLDAYKKIAHCAYQNIKQGGKLYLEIGVGMTRSVRQIFCASQWGFVRAVKDLSGRNRVLVFIKK